MQKVTNHNPLLVSIFLQGLLLFLRYIKNLPLTFLLVNVFVVIVMITTGSPFQKTLFESVAFILRINRSEFTLSSNDVVIFFTILAIPVTLFVEVFKKAFKIKTKTSLILGFLICILLGLHVLQALILSSIGVPVFLFIIALLSTLLYYCLSKLEKLIKRGERFLSKQ